MSRVVEDIKANGQEAYVPSCACEYKDMALTKTVRADWAEANTDLAAFIKAYSLPTETVNSMLAYYVDESGGDMEATARHFLSSNSAWESSINPNGIFGVYFHLAYAKRLPYEDVECTSIIPDKLIVSRYGESLLKGLTTELFPSEKQIFVFRRKATSPSLQAK